LLLQRGHGVADFVGHSVTRYPWTPNEHRVEQGGDRFVSGFEQQAEKLLLERCSDEDGRNASGVLEDRLDDDFPVGLIETVSCALEAQQLGAWDLVRERLSVPDGEHRVSRPVDD
jgi:hypothetical protein